jgi:segregation and condensation protein B
MPDDHNDATPPTVEGDGPAPAQEPADETSTEQPGGLAADTDGPARADLAQLAAVCEAVLSVAGEPVTVESLAGAAGGWATPRDVEAAVELIRTRHEQPASGLVLERVAGGWRLATRPQYEGALRTFLGIRAKARLSQAALEALAIVAYRQPITLPEINYLRGVNSAGVLRTLVEKHLVRAAGRKQVVGTPLLYRTTKDFLVHFGLDDLAALPRLEDPEQSEERGTSES